MPHHSRKALMLIPMMTALLAACTTSGTATPGIASPIPTSTAQAEAACPVTPPTTERPADANTASFSRTWYRSPDGMIWASQGGHWFAGDGNKVLWAKPPRSHLQVSGRRIDGPAPPLEAQLPDGYPGGYQASGLLFATAGCWEITAQADNSLLRFVAAVYPRTYRPAIGSCQDLNDVMRYSDAILIGEMQGSAPDRPGFAWQTIRVSRAWKGTLSVNDRNDLLQDTDSELTLEPGRAYVLFLQSHPGFPWRIFCAQRTLARMDGDQVLSLRQNLRIEPLWSGNTLEALDAQLRAHMPVPAGTAP